MDLHGRDLLTLADYTPEEIRFLLDESKAWKQKFQKRELPRPLAGKALGMIFEKRSTRTRVSCEVGMTYLGGHALFLGKDDIQLGGGETIADTASVLTRMLDGILARVYAHSTVEELAKHATVPVINALSDKYHPLQILADFLTIEEHLGGLQGKKIAWIGDGNNVAQSMFIGAAKMGIDMVVATPEHYMMDRDVVELAQGFAKESGANLSEIHSPKEAAEGADVLVTDTFVSMGEEAEKEKKVKAFNGFSVNQELADLAKKDYIFMHCLPRKEFEVTDEVFFSKNSVVFDEAENRLHTAIAVFASLL